MHQNRGILLHSFLHPLLLSIVVVVVPILVVLRFSENPFLSIVLGSEEVSREEESYFLDV